VAHNGGRSQVVSWFPGNGSFDFLNHWKDSWLWQHVSGNAWLSPANLNAQGYPNNYTGDLHNTTRVPKQSQRSGDYVIRWTGAMTFGWWLVEWTIVSADVGVSVTGSGASLRASGTNGRIVIRPVAPEDGRIVLRITETSALTDIAVLHTADEADWLIGKKFGKRYLERMREANFGVVRFLDLLWQNNTMVTRWTHRKPVDYASWKEYEFRPSLWAGTTTNSGNAFSATLAGFTLVDKAMVLLEFNADATDTATLNVSGTGAKTIKGPSGETRSAVTSAERLPGAGARGCLVFDADLDCWLLDGGFSIDTTLYHGTLRNGWPVEVCVDLCNELGAHPYFNQPYLTVDSPADYMGGLATYCRDNLASGLAPRIAPPNEAWNGVAGFNATPYAIAKTQVWWGGAYLHDWYAKALSKLGQVVQPIYGNNRTRYQLVCEQQTHDGDGANTIVTRMDAPRYVAEGGIAAKHYATRYCITNYWNPRHYVLLGSNQELGYAHEWATATAQRKAEITAQYVTESQQDPSNGFTVARIIQVIQLWRDRAAVYGLPLTYYEGGYSPDYIHINVRSNVVGITKAAQAVVSINSANMVARPGMSVLFESGTVSGMTELNGNTYTCVAVNLANNTFTLDVDTRGFGTWTSGGVVQYVGTKDLLNNFRAASKAVPALAGLTAQLYAAASAAGTEFPSCYLFSGAGGAWSVLDPDIYATPSPQWDAIKAFNFPVPAAGRALQTAGGRRLLTAGGRPLRAG
jgi:hypothetical protein